MANNTLPIGISAKSVTKTFQTSGRDVHALGPFTQDIVPGEIYSIVGPSGCGKSTFLKIVAGLSRPSSGALHLGETELIKPDPRVSVVFQSPTLLPWRTVTANVTLPMEVAHRLDDVAKDRAAELIELVGLSEFADRYPTELSGGMQQRVALARALISDPALLLMDEPFGALDEFTRETMNEEVLKLQARSPKTILFITHSIPEAVFMSDRIGVMSSRPGTITETIPVELGERTPDLRTHSDYYDVIRRVRVALEGAMNGRRPELVND